MMIYSFDEDGLFVEGWEFDVYAPVPERTTFLAPPETTGSERAVWDGIYWKVTSSAPVKSFAGLRAALSEAVTAKRWQVETEGVTLPDGTVVSSSIDSQNRITSAIANAGPAGINEVDFKAETGWVTLTVAQLEQLSIPIALHVQACFSAERKHHEAIETLPGEALSTYDIHSGWPNNK